VKGVRPALVLLGLTGLAIAWPVHLHAAAVPIRGALDSRVRNVVYDPDQVYWLRGYVGYQIHLQFAEGEEFVNLGAGDSGGIDVGAEKNHLFIKPKQEKVGTNLTVLTNRRHYHFDYSVVRQIPDPDSEEVIYSVRFTYPQDEVDRTRAELQKRETEERLRNATAQRPKSFAYWYCGSAAIRPVSAFDDGVQTRLKFGGRSELPAIFVKNDDESEALVNFSVEQDEVVIHRVARRFVVRRGQLVGCIVNKAFDGGGARLDSGTLAPDIQRRTQGEIP
jgi:type IV secretion system protein VirB9